ncbi:DNA repair protein RecO [Thermodesulfobacterium hydrogeniphilum]|uniref:DNA repair protein RecO n=1 Tax=Thermodesulfobacterium hydrogeniphilum TaxID=161156 RepID=UPI00056F9EFC|nr:DNA repair protein RecO [Thermodesulfobacterium hydrogeniphilum]
MFFSTEAIIISKKDLGEIDLLLELFTPKGKFWTIAKGARKSRKRFVNLLEEFNIIKAHLRKTSKGKLPILEKADFIFLPENIRIDYKKYIFLSYIGEILSKISSIGGEKTFNFVKSFINLVETNNNFIWLKPYFELNFLKFLGWCPELFRCVKCGYEPKKIFYFSIPEGGLLCYKCKDDRCEILEANILEILRILIKMPLNKLNFLELEKGMDLNRKNKTKILKIAEDFLKFFLLFDINSLKFLKEVLEGV